jgi:hypothetical protein
VRQRIHQHCVRQGRSKKDCKLISGGNVTVVQAHQAQRLREPWRRAAGQRVDRWDPAPKTRDSDTRTILEVELRRAEARHADLLGIQQRPTREKNRELRNHQKYLDRVSEFKASIARAEADVEGIRRELQRECHLPRPMPSAK